MKNLNFILFLVLVVLISSSCQGSKPPVEDTVSIPYCNEIEIDGDISDWEDVGLIVPLISNLYGELNSSDFSAKMKLSWNEEQLNIMAQIKDDSLYDHLSPLKGDGLEIFFSQEKGTSEIIKYIISPGVTEDFLVPRIDRYSYKVKDTNSDVDDLTVFTKVNEQGYVIELSIPWEKVGISPGSGVKWALNLHMSDVDPGQRKTRYALYHNQDNSTNFFCTAANGT